MIVQGPETRTHPAPGLPSGRPKLSLKLATAPPGGTGPEEISDVQSERDSVRRPGEIGLGERNQIRIRASGGIRVVENSDCTDRIPGGRRPGDVVSVDGDTVVRVVHGDGDVGEGLAPDSDLFVR